MRPVKDNGLFLICQVKKLITDVTEVAFRELKEEQRSAGALLSNAEILESSKTHISCL